MSSFKQIRANSRSVLLPEEDPDAFHELLASLHIEHQPVGAHEDYLVRQMAVSQWRMDRLQRIEAGLLASRLEIIRQYEADYENEDDQPPPEPGREYLETSRQLGAAFYDDSRAVDSFSKLCRYEAAIRRARAHHAHPEKTIFPNEPNSPP
jgi:hypothetical protein